MDWVMGLVGGLMIGSAGAMMLLINGRIMGISGIFGGLVDRSGWSSAGERVAFVAGLVAMPAVLNLWLGAEAHVTDNWAVIIAGGVLVGLGTRLANGCTSGHGVCGLARLSRRSLAANLSASAGGKSSASVLPTACSSSTPKTRKPHRLPYRYRPSASFT